MRGMPTEDHVKILRVVYQSPDGIEAVSDRQCGLECVAHGWLSHTEHRRNEGGVVDVWSPIAQGRAIVESRVEEHGFGSVVKAA